MKLYNCSPFCPLCDQWSPFLLFTPMTAVQPIPVTPSAHYQMITQFVDTSQIVTSLPKEIRSWNWISANNLTLNTRKTKQIIFDIGKMSVQTSSLSTSVVTVRAYAGLSWTTKTSAVTKKMYNCRSPLDVTFTKVRKNIWHPDMRENLSGYSGATQRPARLKPVMKWKLLEHQCHYWQWSKVFFTMGWEGANHERSPCYIFKLDWNLEDGFGMDKAGQL